MEPAPGCDDRLKLLCVAVVIGLLTAAFIIAKVGRDALFFQEGGIQQMPLAAMIIAAASVPLAVVFVKAMKIWGARRARIGALWLTAATLALSVPLVRPGDAPFTFAMFIFIPSIFGILFASLWLLTSDLFQDAPKNLAARAFGKAGASSIGGGMLGALVAKGIAPFIEARWLLFVAAMLVLLVVGLVVLIHRRYPGRPAALRDVDETRPSPYAPLTNPYARTLLLIAMTGALAGVLIDMQFYIVAASARLDEKGNADFFANFYILLSVSAFLLQLFLAEKIQDRIGLRGGLMILPFALAGGATFATAAATAFSHSALKVTESSLRSSIHRSIWEQTFIPFAAAERSYIKLSVDGVGAKLAEGLGAGAMLIWMHAAVPGGVPASQMNTTWMSWLTLLVVIIWLGITHKLRIQARKEMAPAILPIERECGRLPDQCACTTELGKGIA